MAKKLIAGYDLAGTRITGSGAPSADSDLAPKSFVDAACRAVSYPFPLSGYGLTAATGDPASFMATSTSSSGTTAFIRTWIPAGTPINNLWAAVRTAGTYATTSVPNQLGVYDDDGTLLATTADDNTLWSAVGWRGGALTTPVPAQGVGRFVYLAWIVGGYTVYFACLADADDNQVPWFAKGPGQTRQRCMLGFSQTALPSSFNPATFGYSTTFITLIGAN